MGTRRQSSEAAVQILYQRDLNPHEALDDAVARFWKEQDYPDDIRAFAEKLARGALEKRDAVDEQIKRVTENWELERIAAVDRNILRLAIHEMMFCDDIPPVVSINEAVDIAKKFSTKESGKFVNGILDRIRKELPRTARTAGPREPESGGSAPTAAS